MKLCLLCLIKETFNFMPIVKWATFFTVRVLLMVLSMVISCNILWIFREISDYILPSSLLQLDFYMYNFGVISPYLQKWKKM